MNTDYKALFLKALEANSEYSEAHFQLALIYEQEKDYENVEKHFLSAISCDEAEISILEHKGEELLKKFQFQNAKTEFMKAQEKKNHCADVYYSKAKYLLNMQKIKEAIANYNSSIKMNELNYKVHRDLGKLLIKNNQLDDARKHLEKAVSLNYGDSKSHYYLAVIMFKMKDFDDAEQHFLSSLDIIMDNEESRAKKLYKKIRKDWPEFIHPDIEKIIN